MSRNAQQSEKIRQKARELGYVNCGFTHVQPFVKYQEALEKRMTGFPHSRSLYEGLLSNVFPERTFPEAKALIVTVWKYGIYRIPEGLNRYIGKMYLFDGRQERTRQYVAGRKFQEWLTDLGLRSRRGGVPDRQAAVRAGVGSFGRNNFIYTSGGSWVMIETWLVDAELDVDAAAEDVPCPQGCRRCVEACPTGALCEPYSMDWSQCIPYLTYSSPGLTPESLREKMGTWIYGCDVCQDVCPLNKGQWEQVADEPVLEALAQHISPKSLLEMDESFFHQHIYPLFFYTKDFIRWQTNAMRAIGNSDDQTLVPLLDRFLTSEDERLREMARWAIERLRG